MKTIFFRKFFPLFVCTAILFAVILYCVSQTDPVSIRFQVGSSTQSVSISLYEDDDGSSYVFLPSYAKMDQVIIDVTGNNSVSIDGVYLTDGMDCSSFMIGAEYELRIGSHAPSKLQFLQSANVATMYIDNVQGTMEHIHEDKDYKGIVSLSLITENGEINYSNQACTISGRGNTTWDYYDKKPYNLTLSSESNLLGMGNGSNWVLLANARDASNLRNKIVIDLARNIGLNVPDCAYVDVYLNGVYNGLYLLTEKIEIGDTRLDIDPHNGDFLCKIDKYDRWATLQSPFLTKYGRTVEISEPKSLLSDEISRIEALVNELEQEILSCADIETSSIFDIDSWVKRYLIDEISGNADSDGASSYFYYTNGVFFAGPVWDYDWTFGNFTPNSDPASLIKTPYYNALLENKSFYNYMITIYRDVLLPELTKLLEGGIQQISNDITAPTYMNGLRWKSMFLQLRDSGVPVQLDETQIISYLGTRVEFINDIWLNNIPYCTVQFELSPGTSFHNVSVLYGSILETSSVDLESEIWLDSENGTIFDPSQPITKDMILTRQSISDNTGGADSSGEMDTTATATRDIATVLSLICLAFFLICFGIVDIRYRIKERITANERPSHEIPP